MTLGPDASAPPLHVVVAGASGFLGTHLVAALRTHGHRVTTLTRGATAGAGQSAWDPYAGVLDTALIGSADVVVNLAGAPTVGNPHSSRWARELRESRVTTTRLLARTIAASTTPPAYLAGNGISVYGDRGPEVLTEASDSCGDALLTDVCREWEAAAEPARDAGSRVCVLRTAPVYDADAPPLKMLAPLFKLGLGARLGDGRQYMAMVSLRDWVGAVVHLAQHPDAAGPFNITVPHPPTNAEFTQALAHAVHRPAFVFAPAPLLRLAGGRLAPELLGSLNVRPAALEGVGYAFEDADVTSLLATALH